MKAFGVGCLHFSINENLDKNITIEKYTLEIRKVLENLSTVSNITIHYDENAQEAVIENTQSFPLMQNGDACYPQIPSFHLNFDIYIPTRVQASTISEEENSINTETENFTVHFMHDWYGPVTYIECKSAGIYSSPSQSIQIIREYLVKELSSSKSFISLDFIGPSPFHADMFLVDSIASEDKFALDVKKLPGYDQFLFKYSSTLFKSEDRAFRNLLRDLRQELAFFYTIKVQESKRIDDWLEIQNSLLSILDIESDEIKTSIKEKYITKRKLFKKAFMDIGSFRGNEIFINHARKKNYSSIYESGKHKTFFDEHTKSSINSAQNYPLQETTELLNYFDQKSSKAVELIIIFLAAISGGTIGSIITVLLN